MATMKSQNITGVVLFVVGTAILWLIASYNYSSFPYQFGSVTARSLIFTVVLTLLLAITPYRKNVSLSLIVGIMYVISVGMASVDMFKHGEDQRSIVHEGVGAIDAFLSGEEIKSDTVSPNDSSFINMMRDYLSRVQRIHLEYQKELEPLLLDGILEPRNLVNVKTAKQSLVKVNAISQTIPNYESRLLNERTQFENRLKSAKDKDSREGYVGFMKTKDHGIERMKAYFSLQKELMTVFADIIEFAIDRDGKLTIQNGVLILEDNDSVNLYNAYLDKIELLAEKEEQFYLDQQQTIQNQKDVLEKQL